MRDLNYQLKLLCKHSHEGSFETREDARSPSRVKATHGDQNLRSIPTVKAVTELS